MMVYCSEVRMSSNNEDLIELKVGRRLVYNGYYGTLKYVGEVPPTSGIWLGVDWDDPTRGKHDGSHEGVKYFDTRHPTSGSFIRPGKVNFGQDILSALYNKYCKKDGLDPENVESLKKEFNVKFVEMIGIDKIHETQCDFANLTVSVLTEMYVNGPGPDGKLGQMCPNIRELNLSENLLPDWEVVAEIVAQLPRLRFLMIGRNRLAIPEDPCSLQKAFKNLDYLSFPQMAYDWTCVMKCAPMWSSIRELEIPNNDITTLETPPSDLFTCLSSLHIGSNNIQDWKEILKLGHLPRLETLIVCDTKVNELWFPVADGQKKTSLFQQLRHLNINSNNIHSWESVSELDKLQSLEELKFRENPVLELENFETCRQLVIARVANLKVLNSSPVTVEERTGAEYDYLKRYGRLWLEVNEEMSMEKLQAFYATHPCYTRLVQKYGAPEEGELNKSTVLKSKILEIELFSPNTEKTFKKKLPQSIELHKVVGLAQRLFHTGSVMPSLSYISSKCPEVEVPLDNESRNITFYGIESGDRVCVRW